MAAPTTPSRCPSGYASTREVDSYKHRRLLYSDRRFHPLGLSHIYIDTHTQRKRDIQLRTHRSTGIITLSGSGVQHPQIYRADFPLGKFFLSPVKTMAVVEAGRAWCTRPSTRWLKCCACWEKTGIRCAACMVATAHSVIFLIIRQQIALCLHTKYSSTKRHILCSRITRKLKKE